MSSIARIVLCVCVLLCLSACGGTAINSGHVAAARDLLGALTTTNADLVNLSRQMRAQGDKENVVPASSNAYARRLAALTDKLRNEDGLNLNFKVYMTKDINANATADGSIRVYSGLMDLMNDDELFYIVGHEIGHVKNGDSLDAIRVHYASSGFIKAAGATLGASSGQLSSLLHTAINAQFSQAQEYAADAYGYNLMKKYGVHPRAAVSALEKLNTLGESGGVLASHPNSKARAQRIVKMIAAEPGQ